jgi:hypothetical protein
MLIAIVGIATQKGVPSRFSYRLQSKLGSAQSPSLVAQADDDDTDENEVSTDEVEKYVSVYKAMQRDRSLTVDQAAAAQGLTIEQFRQLENRVQRDDAALQQARDELETAARGAAAPNASPSPLPP